MNPQQLKDMREGVLGFASALAFGAAVIVILLGVVGYFDHGTKYQYSNAVAKEHRR